MKTSPHFKALLEIDIMTNCWSVHCADQSKKKANEFPSIFANVDTRDFLCKDNFHQSHDVVFSSISAGWGHAKSPCCSAVNDIWQNIFRWKFVSPKLWVMGPIKKSQFFILNIACHHHVQKKCKIQNVCARSDWNESLCRAMVMIRLSALWAPFEIHVFSMALTNLTTFQIHHSSIRSLCFNKDLAYRTPLDPFGPKGYIFL